MSVLIQQENEILAGKDAHLYDKTDWDIDEVPLFMNITYLPVDIQPYQFEQMLREALLVASRYALVKHYFAGVTEQEYIPGAGVAHYAPATELAQIYKDTVTGVCFTRLKGQNVQKGNSIAEGYRFYINADKRSLPDRFSQATISHETFHGALGVHGHNNKYGALMYRSSNGNFLPTIWDMEMTDAWDCHYAILHWDMSLSIPIAIMGNGQVEFIHLLPVSDNPLRLTWQIGSHHAWDAPESDLFRIEDKPTSFEGMPALRVHLSDVRGVDIRCRASFLYTPHDNLVHLEYAGQ